MEQTRKSSLKLCPLPRTGAQTYKWRRKRSVYNLAGQCDGWGVNHLSVRLLNHKLLLPSRIVPKHLFKCRLASALLISCISWVASSVLPRKRNKNNREYFTQTSSLNIYKKKNFNFLKKKTFFDQNQLFWSVFCMLISQGNIGIKDRGRERHTDAIWRGLWRREMIGKT